MKGSNVKESHTLPKFQILAKLNCQFYGYSLRWCELVARTIIIQHKIGNY